MDCWKDWEWESPWAVALACKLGMLMACMLVFQRDYGWVSEKDSSSALVMVHLRGIDWAMRWVSQMDTR
jgi:hypothetical protein